MSNQPIGDYALLSDCRSAALVSAAGSVDWLCFPRFDSPSVFGRILGEAAGHWSVRAAGVRGSSRRYLGPSMVLETRHRTDNGDLTVTDALVLGSGRRGHDLGDGSPGTLLRSLACTRGSVDVEFECAPRPGYGLLAPVLRGVPGGLLITSGDEVLTLSSPLSLEPKGGTASATFRLLAGESVAFALHRPHSGGEEPVFWDQAEMDLRLADTLEGWTSWSGIHQNYRGPWQDLVAGSGRVLQALSYYPSGAIVAAPTTSLPEVAGGIRNWDYRYTWVRDASMTLQALWVAACPDEAGTFFQFLATAAARQLAAGEDLHIMYGIGGERELPERELSHLPGWRGSAPVRVGNGAWDQRQLDVYGELLDAAATMRDSVAELAPETLRFLADAADVAAARWRSPDQGIWEVRGEPRHFLYSKLMCWVAVDRAIGLAAQLRATDRVPGWTAAREEIRESICTHSCSAPFGWPTHWSSPGGPSAPGRSSSAPPASPPTWA